MLYIIGNYRCCSQYLVVMLSNVINIFKSLSSFEGLKLIVLTVNVAE